MYDHFLATDTSQFQNETVLKQFAAQTYQLLEPHTAFFSTTLSYDVSLYEGPGLALQLPVCLGH
ncbi:MAG: DUF479 domain-containing protein [Chitinophagaceae bacterium]|nr:DUF479 domain-containing protein [Chitinophagaceae bacterium]